MDILNPMGNGDIYKGDYDDICDVKVTNEGPPRLGEIYNMIPPELQNPSQDESLTSK